MRGPGALVLAALLAVAPATAAPAQTPGVTRARLPNGLTVLVRENPVAPVVAISLVVRMGTRTETPDTAGIANLLQLMVVRGTPTRDGTAIVEAADRWGGTIDAYGDVDTSEIAATALARHWSDLLGLVADVALRPTLPAGTTTAVQQFIERQIRNRGDRPYDVGVDALLAHLYGPHPYAWHPLGRRESVARVDGPALRAYYQRHYVPGQLVLAVSGRVAPAEVVAEATRLFGAMPAAPAPAVRLPAPPPFTAGRQVLEVPGAQAQILMAAPAPALTEPDYAAVKLLATVLGGGMAGRFFSELRDKQGLAYTTGAQYPSRIERGYFLVQLGTAPENVDKAEAALRTELRRIREEPVGPEELRIAKAYLLGNLAMDRRTNARQAWYLATFEALGVGPEFLDRYRRAVERVSAAELQAAARRYLAELHTVVVRPPAR
jgi:predicted Zn-dependent peptidase